MQAASCQVAFANNPPVLYLHLLIVFAAQYSSA